MSARRRLLAHLAAISCLSLGLAGGAAAQAPARAVDPRLPFVEVPADSGHTLALLLSGDGGWAGGDRAVAAALARGGVAVVGVDIRAYLRGARRTPDGTSSDAAAIVERYAALWHRDRVVLVGYSRGANLMPFVVSRWPQALRNRLALVALVGLSSRASFDFHWQDILHEVARPTDLPTRPELERIRGTPLLCLYGDGEKTSICPSLDAGLARVARHNGGHVLDNGSGAAVAAVVLETLRSAGRG